MPKISIKQGAYRSMYSFKMAYFTFVFLAITVGAPLCDASCSQLYAVNVDSGDISTIVNKHNSLRAQVSQGKVPGQPKGTNLKTMKWDSYLAGTAQNIANTCIYGHSRVNDSRFSVGQNIYTTWSTSIDDIKTEDWNGAVDYWFKEHKDFTYPNISRGVTGHYTQVVWADTYLVGCGFSAYYDNQKYNKFYVCNYGPAGNVYGEAPYKL